MKMEINTGGGGINIDGVIEQAKARRSYNSGGFCEAGGGNKRRRRYTVRNI